MTKDKACTNTSKSEPSSVAEPPTKSAVLNIWWDKGYILEEDEALQQVINNWEKKSGNPVKQALFLHPR